MARQDRTSEIYGDNVVNSFFNFNNIGSWTASNGGSATHDANVVFNGQRSLRIINTAPTTGNTVASIKDRGTTINEDGNYWVSCYIRNATNEQLTGSFRTYKNTIIENTSAFTLEVDDQNEWVGFYAYITGLTKGDNIEFDFVLNQNASSLLANNTINVDGFGLYQNDRGLVLPPRYSQPFVNTTGWQSRIDTTNTQSLTATTDNLIAFTGTLSENGGLVLMDSNSKVTPIYENDVVTFDFACTAVTPNDNNEYMHLRFIVNGVVFRSKTHRFLDNNGEDDFVSVSWTLPVGSDFITNGGELFINPSVNVDIKDRYVAVTKTHNAV